MKDYKNKIFFMVSDVNDVVMKTIHQPVWTQIYHSILAKGQSTSRVCIESKLKDYKF
jgi:hypothetical protein